MKSHRFMPRCFFPLCYGIHWGYIIAEPEENGTVRIQLSDSYGSGAPRSILNDLRSYLSLTFREAKFVVDKSNHCTDVLGYQKQPDGYSCGFYVILAMGNFCGGSGKLCSAMTRSGKTHKATARMFDKSKSDAASANGLTGNL